MRTRGLGGKPDPETAVRGLGSRAGDAETGVGAVARGNAVSLQCDNVLKDAVLAIEINDICVEEAVCVHPCVCAWVSNGGLPFRLLPGTIGLGQGSFLSLA